MSECFHLNSSTNIKRNSFLFNFIFFWRENSLLFEKSIINAPNLFQSWIKIKFHALVPIDLRHKIENTEFPREISFLLWSVWNVSQQIFTCSYSSVESLDFHFKELFGEIIILIIILTRSTFDTTWKHLKFVFNYLSLWKVVNCLLLLLLCLQSFD